MLFLFNKEKHKYVRMNEDRTIETADTIMTATVFPNTMKESLKKWAISNVQDGYSIRQDIGSNFQERFLEVNGPQRYDIFFKLQIDELYRLARIREHYGLMPGSVAKGDLEADKRAHEEEGKPFYDGYDEETTADWKDRDSKVVVNYKVNVNKNNALKTALGVYDDPELSEEDV